MGDTEYSEHMIIRIHIRIDTTTPQRQYKR